MRSCPFSQLKLKPNDAGPVNPALGGSCPPPRPVHAASTNARMPAAASKMDRRNNRGAPVFKVSSKTVRCEGRADPDRQDPPPTNSGPAKPTPTTVKPYPVVRRARVPLSFPLLDSHAATAAEAGLWNPGATISTRNGQCNQ
jgi:hypothetical protein